MAVDDLGRVVQLGGVRYLNAADQVLDEMLTGWRRQQLSRNLSIDTINGRERVVRRFLDYTNELPWHWTHAHVDEYFGDLRAVKHRSQNTVRGYQNAVQLFCAYLVDPVYGWGARCEELFGTHPVQVCFEWNTAAHTQDNEQDPTKRAFTHEELQAFFDHADAEISRIRTAGRKGWLPAFRDSVLFKTAYAFGLRRTEVRHLRTIDFERNPHAREFGRHGALEVRYGKAHKGSAPKRRTVLTVFDWSVEVITHWTEEGLPLFEHIGLDLFPSERGTLVSETALNAPLLPLSRTARPGQRPGYALFPPVLRHAPDRGGLRPVIRRPRLRLHHQPLHVRVGRFQAEDGSADDCPAHRSPREGGT